MKDTELWNAYAEGRKDERETMKYASTDPVMELKRLIEAARAKADQIDNAGVLSWAWAVSEKLSDALKECDEIETRDRAAEELDWYESERREAA